MEDILHNRQYCGCQMLGPTADGSENEQSVLFVYKLLRALCCLKFVGKGHRWNW